MQISWKHSSESLNEPLSFEEKVDVFYERIWGWQLHIAALILNGGKDHMGKVDFDALPHSAFGGLQILLSYFETIAKYEAGFSKKGDSRHYFKKGVRSVCPEVNALDTGQVEAFLDNLYGQARCGLYHSSQTGGKISLSGVTEAAFTYETGQQRIILNTHSMVGLLKSHLMEYRDRVLTASPQDLVRTNFEARFAFDNPSAPS